jgi:monoterpene epsilon-lactone hydrolase
MASPEYEGLRKHLKPGLADPKDSWELAREKMTAVHPTKHPDDVQSERIQLGGVPCAWVSTPEVGDADRVLFMCHGGAFISTGLEHYIPYAGRFSRPIQARVLIFEYSLAPQARFPTQINEGVAAYRALLETGVSPEKVCFIGDSCGGGIGIGILLTLRDAGDPLPAAFVGVTPWFDLEVKGEAALNPRGVDPYVEPEWIRNRGRDYVGEEGDLRDPRVSPIHADLSGLPPVFLSVGEIDTTRDDSTRLATHAGACGVNVTLEVVPEMIHGFHGLSDLFPESRDALQRIGEFVRRHIP